MIFLATGGVKLPPEKRDPLNGSRTDYGTQPEKEPENETE